MLTELKELTEQKKPKLKQTMGSCWAQADRAVSGGVGPVTKSTIHISAEAFLPRFVIICQFFSCGMPV